MANRGPAARAFESRRLDLFARHALERRHIDHHMEAEVFPYDDHGDREESEPRIGQDEYGLDSNRAEEGRRDTGVAVEDEAPDEPGGDLGEDVWQEVNQAEERVGSRLLIDEQGQQQRDRHLDEKRHSQND